MPLGELFDTRSRHVRGREDADREALAGELIPFLFGLRLERVVRELELHGVLEHDGRAIAEVIEERRGRAQRWSKGIGAGRVPALAQGIDQARVGRKVGTAGGLCRPAPGPRPIR